MEKIKIGIIGCGGIANGKHMPSYKNLADEAEGRFLRYYRRARTESKRRICRGKGQGFHGL